MTDDVFHRGGAAEEKEQRECAERARRRAKEWLAATDRLCANADFEAWLWGALDDLGLFDRPEVALSDFGQGFRSAAHRIRNRMLEAPKAVDLFTRLAKRHHAELHRSLVADRQRGEFEETEKA